MKEHLLYLINKYGKQLAEDRACYAHTEEEMVKDQLAIQITERMIFLKDLKSLLENDHFDHG